MSKDAFRDIIASRLKTYRTAKGMSLDATAEATGVSKAMLGQIERRESAPTIATLWKIARGLGVSFSSFFAPRSPEDESAPTFPDDPNMRVRVIFPFAPATRMEVFEVTLSGGHHQASTAHQVGVVEHVIVLRGTLELRYHDKWHQLSEGDARRFHADVAHDYRAMNGPAVFQNIICYT